jgi:4-hydroxy-tetrahydrodipicolinate synthase
VSPFRGSLVALPTFFDGGRLDLETLGDLIDWHVEEGTDGLVVLGTTGEAATLSDAERAAVLEWVLDRAGGRLPVIAGTGTNCTRRTLELTRAAEAAGVDGALVVTPYYNRPTQAGLVAHYGTIAEGVSLPLALYNVPARTGCDLLPETVAEIAERFPTVVAIKEASGSLERAQALLDDGSLGVLAGEDALIGELARRGAVGAIGVVANVVPSLVAELTRRPRPDPDRTAAIETLLAPLVRALFVETNPVPVKTLLAAMGHGTGEVRLPLVPLSDASRALVLEAAAGCGAPVELGTAG